MDRQGPVGFGFNMSLASAVPLYAFSGIWRGVNGCGEISTVFNVVRLSLKNISFYWAFLPMDYYEDVFILLSCFQDWGSQPELQVRSSYLPSIKPNKRDKLKVENE